MANLNEIAQDWTEHGAQELAEELRTGPHVHVITGDLKASFRAVDNTVVSDVPYANEELTRPGNRRVDPFTPHTALDFAWEDIEEEVVEQLGVLLQRDLEIGPIRIEVRI